MKKLYTLLAASLFSGPLFALPSSEYSCSGRDAYYQNEVEFQLSYADWDQKAGYASQLLTITSVDGKPQNQLIDLQEKVLPGCTARQSLNSLSLTKASDDKWSAEFVRGCDAEIEYQIKATCTQNY